MFHLKSSVMCLSALTFYSRWVRSSFRSLEEVFSESWCNPVLLCELNTAIQYVQNRIRLLSNSYNIQFNNTRSFEGRIWNTFTTWPDTLFLHFLCVQYTTFQIIKLDKSLTNLPLPKILKLLRLRTLAECSRRTAWGKDLHLTPVYRKHVL